MHQSYFNPINEALNSVKIIFLTYQGFYYMSPRTTLIRAKKIGSARQIFGTVRTILRHGTPNFRRVNVSVPNVMWHQRSKF